MNLFGPDVYTAPGKTPRKPRVPRKPADPPPPTVAVYVDGCFRFGHRKTPGVVHAGTGKQKLGADVTFCGLIGMPLTYRVGDIVHGCKKCIDRGAPARRADAA